MHLAHKWLSSSTGTHSQTKSPETATPKLGCQLIDRIVHQTKNTADMEAFNISIWHKDMRPKWFDMVFARAMCPQGCKTEDQAIKWEAEAKRVILHDPYAVSPLFIYHHCPCLLHI